MCRTATGLGRRGHRVWVLSHPESRLSRSAPGGIRLVARRLGMDYNPLMIAWLVGFIKRKGIDLVVTNIRKEVIIGGVAARLAGIPNIRRIGNHDDLNNRVKWSQEHLVDHNIIPCNLILEEARRRLPWVVPSQFTTVYNGVNPVDFSDGEIAKIRKGWGLAREHLVVGCTSGLAKVKRIDALISVFAGLRVKHPEVRLVIAGEGPEEAGLREKAREAGAGDSVVFAGFTADPAMVAAAYDIAVLNSSIEGFPNVLVEYMAAGKPVVSTRVGGVTEILEDRKNGLLVEPGDTDGLTKALLELMRDRETRDRLGREARRKVEAGFTEDKMLDRLEALFSRLAGTGRSG